jgi:hypothetical protein
MSLHDDLQLINTHAAEKLATPRKINGVEFDGTMDISISGGGGGTSGDATSIAGVPVSVSSLTNGDVLQYSG